MIAGQLSWEGQKSLVGYSPWGHKQLDMTEHVCIALGKTKYIWVYLVAYMVKNLPAMQKTWVGSLGWGYSLEKGMATRSSIHA